MEIIELPFSERACVFVTKDKSKIIVHPGGHTYDCAPEDLPIGIAVSEDDSDKTKGTLYLYPLSSFNRSPCWDYTVINAGDHCSYVRRPDLGCQGIFMVYPTPGGVVSDDDYEECALDAIHDNMLNEITHAHRAPVNLSVFRVNINNPISAITVATTVRGKNAWMRFSYLKQDEGMVENYLSVIDNKIVYQGDEGHVYLKWLARSGHGPITTRVSTYDQRCANSYIVVIGGISGGAVWLSRELVADENIVTMLDDRYATGEEIAIEERFAKFVDVLADIVRKSNENTPMQGMAQMAYESAYISHYPELNNFKFNN